MALPVYFTTAGGQGDPNRAARSSSSSSATGNVRIIDRGWKRIKTEIEALRNRGVKVGMLAGGPSQDGVRIVDYAAFNEFGTESIPSRPFMRRTADEAERPIIQFTASITQRLIAGQIGVEGVLDSLGLWYQMRIRATIRSSPSWAAPNSPMTIALKGSSVPLIDHGVMVGAVNYEKTRM